MRVTLVLLLASCAMAQPGPDLILYNGRVWTADEARPEAQAVAVARGRISAVGSDAEVRTLAGPSTTSIDLKGRLLLPGFIDNHAHFMAGGFQLQSVDLRAALTMRQFADLIADRARRHPGRWITGGDWDHDAWPGGALPTRALIDTVTPGTPVFVNRYDGHMGLANSLALRLAGITRDTPDPPGGAIVKDPVTGEPTGILKDEAMDPVWRVIPDPSREELLEAARGALAEARRYGITSVQDISSRADVRTYRDLLASGELTARMYCRLPLGEWRDLSEEGLTAGSGDAWIRMGSLKAFADGSLGSSTALFFEPYDSDPTTRGLPSDIALSGALERWALSADSARLQLSVHAIGDSANSLVLGIMERAAARNTPWDRRFRVEHAQHVRPADFGRFARLGVIASVQPYHAIDDGRWAEGRIGRERCKSTYPFASFLASGVRLSFGSDWTVGPLNPLPGLYAAVTRRTTDGKNPGGWFPEQKISVADAVRAYTINNAYAAFEEQEKGSIVPGKMADLVVLERDIFEIPAVEIADVRVDLTIVDGRIVHRREGQR
ncbi:MAG: putative metal-dependent hydrolase [Bacteroidetes bacterium]|nr:putative metal-dependent hydrolase [Bacteroidota bacterium]